ncbi:MAG TPA: hypothetical protein VG267_02280 [Terracidiphilus sp.]|jgi:hypothetical protein|nr:hypothetical protein [Terracidiphilus sp.]
MSRHSTRPLAEDQQESGLRIETCYKEACNDHRFYADLRFKQLSLFALVDGFLLKEFVDSTSSPKIAIIGAIGVVVSSALWVMEIRSSLYAQKAKGRQRLLEPDNISAVDAELRRFEARWTILNATNAVLTLFIGSFLFWFWQTFENSSSPAKIAVGALGMVIFAVLLAFSVREYWTLFTHAVRTWKW